jgi:hypothetical protein
LACAYHQYKLEFYADVSKLNKKILPRTSSLIIDIFNNITSPGHGPVAFSPWHCQFIWISTHWCGHSQQGCHSSYFGITKTFRQSNVNESPYHSNIVVYINRGTCVYIPSRKSNINKSPNKNTNICICTYTRVFCSYILLILHKVYINYYGGKLKYLMEGQLTHKLSKSHHSIF